MSFKEITYKGKPLIRDVDAGTCTAYYQHIYRTNFDGTYRRHACLKQGAWCWKNALSYPQDIPGYLKRRLGK